MADEKDEKPILIDVVYENLNEPESFSFEEFYDATGLESDDQVSVEDALRAFNEKDSEAQLLLDQLSQSKAKVSQMRQRQAEGIVIAGILAFFIGMASKK